MGGNVRNPFSGLTKRYPRLMATPENIGRIRKLIDANDADIEKIRVAVVRRAEKEIKDDLAPNRNAADFLKETRNILRRLQTLGMAWLLDPQPRYVDQVRKNLSAICDF